MRFRRLATLLLTAMLCAASPALRSPAQAAPSTSLGETAAAPATAEPAGPPAIPTQIPPHVTKKAPAPTAGSAHVRVNLPKGWSIVSFPLSRITTARGFTHALYRFSGGQFFVVDPVADPGSLDTRLGYVAYADAPTPVTLEGEQDESVIRSVSLPQGWSLVGCPSSIPFAWNQATVTVGALTKNLPDAVAPNGWLGATAWPPTGPQTLTGAPNLVPGQGVWLWTRMPVRIHLHPASTSPAAPSTSTARPSATTPGAPLITGLVPPTVGPGGSVQIEGNGFGADGDVAIAGNPVEPDDVLDWSPTCIQLRVPQDAVTGPVTVTSSHLASNAVPLTIKGDAGGPATLIGQIQNEQGQPVQGAQILLDSGQSALTSASGAWLVADVQAGQHLAYVTAVGYRLGVASLDVGATPSQSVLIRLTLAGDGPPPANAAVAAASSGSGPGWTDPPGGWAHWTAPPGGAPHWTMPAGSVPLPSPVPADAPIDPLATAQPPPDLRTGASVRVVADDYTSKSHRWWVSGVQVSLQGQSTPRWSKAWAHNQSGNAVSLACNGVMVGATYVLRATWTREDGAKTITREWTRTVDAPDQTFELDSPY